MASNPGSSKNIPQLSANNRISENNIDIERILQQIEKSQTTLNSVENNTNCRERTRDNIISKDNPRCLKNLQLHARQPIIIKRNTEQLEKLKRFRNELMELSQIVDVEINKTEVEWLSLTYEADKLENRQDTSGENGKKVASIEEIDEQLRNCCELPTLDLRPTISKRIDKDEEFDSDSS